ncbi:MAG: hypothetical protein WBG92_03125 [Thiohalocapsa sp.]
MALLQEVLAFLDQRVSLVERINWGLALQDVGGVMRHVLDVQYPIRRCMPFRGHASVGLDEYWCTLRRFVEQRGGVVITAFGGRLAHWTVIRDVTPRCLLLFDSAGRAQVGRRWCVMASDSLSRRHYVLYPTHTYFLWGVPD